MPLLAFRHTHKKLVSFFSFFLRRFQKQNWLNELEKVYNVRVTFYMNDYTYEVSTTEL